MRGGGCRQGGHPAHHGRGNQPTGTQFTGGIVPPNAHFDVASACHRARPPPSRHRPHRHPRLMGSGAVTADAASICDGLRDIWDGGGRHHDPLGGTGLGHRPQQAAPTSPPARRHSASTAPRGGCASPAAGLSGTATLNAAPSVRCRCAGRPSRFRALPTQGHGVYASVRLRGSGGGGYAAQMRVSPDGTVRVSIRRTDSNGAGTVVAPEVTIPAHAQPGGWLVLAAQVSGTTPVTLRARVWQRGSRGAGLAGHRERLGSGTDHRCGRTQPRRLHVNGLDR